MRPQAAISNSACRNLLSGRLSSLLRLQLPLLLLFLLLCIPLTTTTATTYHRDRDRDHDHHDYAHDDDYCRPYGLRVQV